MNLLKLLTAAAFIVVVFNVLFQHSLTSLDGVKEGLSEIKDDLSVVKEDVEGSGLLLDKLLEKNNE